MPAYVPGDAGGLAVKLVSVFADNHTHGLPSHQALITLFDARTGTPLCVMDGTEITAVRTAAASVLSMRMLARDDSSVLAVLGAGVQGSAHLDAMTRTHNFAEVRIASRNQLH